MGDTVLIVDDDPLNRVVICAALGSRYRIVEATDAATAYRVLAAGGIDLVLLDVMLPEESGFDACRRIKAESTEYLPVLLLTALDQQEDRNVGLSMGADDFLTKPVDRLELNLRIEVFLKLRRQERTIREQVRALHQLGALKDDLVSLILHDLRNPLSGLMAFLNILQEGLGATDHIQDVRGALTAANRMHETVEDLLRVRSLEEGQLRPVREPVHLRELLEGAAATMRGAARERGVELQLASVAGMDASFDPKLVRRAVENLLANAIKFSRPGDVVQLAASVADEVRIEVADRGPGLSQNARDTLFEKFSTLAEGTRDARRGFGLGLYMVSLVATAHGGSVRADDRAGGGTVFSLRLPAGERA